MTAQEIIEAAHRKLGMGRELDTDKYTDFLAGLQNMLRFWSSQKILIPATIHETVTLTGGKGEYTWGETGDIATIRPDELVKVSVRDSSGTDYSVDIIRQDKYECISNKATTGLPGKVFVRYSYPLAYLYLYPVPSEAYVLVVDSVKPFTETSSFDALGSTIAFPKFYEAPIIFNLALWMSMEFGITPLELTVKIANDTYRSLANHNASNHLNKSNMDDICKLVSGNSTYNINSGA